MKQLTIYLLLIIPFLNSFGQGDSTQTSSYRPKLMVIPNAKEGEDLRTVLEKDINKKIALAKIQEAFNAKGYNTVDFVAKLKAVKTNQAFNTNTNSDIKTQIIELSGADIFVQFDLDINKSESGTSVSVVLSAYETATGNSLATKVGSSGKFYVDDIGRLTVKAIENITPEFLIMMQTKFEETRKNGVSLYMEISFDVNSKYNMSSDNIGNSSLPLSDQIEQWIAKNSYKNSYHIMGTTNAKMIFDDVRIPIRNSSGLPYNSNKFALEFFLFLKSLSLEPSKDIKGNTIYITIK